MLSTPAFMLSNVQNKRKVLPVAVFLLAVSASVQCVRCESATKIKVTDDPTSLDAVEFMHARRGLELADRQDPDRAAREFRYCKDYEKFTDAFLLQMAWSYFHAGKNEEAVSALDFVIARTDRVGSQPKHPSKEFAQALDERSYCNLYLGKLDAASADCKRLIAFDIDFKKRIYERQAVIFTREKRYAEAIRAYDAIDAKFGFDRHNKFERASCLQRMGRYAEAVNAYSALLGKMPVSSNSAHDFSESAFFGSVLAERSKCFDKLGKSALALADRKQQERLSHTFSTELFPDLPKIK
ncbi:MAG TPA: tetratricopeptide repeat protein [Oculatellaceae cyanobacterium]